MISRLSELSPAKLKPQIRVVDTEQAMFPLRFNLLAQDFYKYNLPLRSIL